MLRSVFDLILRHSLRPLSIGSIGVLVLATLHSGCAAASVSTSVSQTPFPTAPADPASLSFVELQSVNSIPLHDILELSFSGGGTYNNKFLDVDLEVLLTSPSGIRRHVKGFFHDGSLWKVRFRPDELGHWTYTYTLTDHHGSRTEGHGIFDCIPANTDGAIRINSTNPYRWVFANGKPYFPIGLQDCVGNNGTQPTIIGIDGEGREDNSARQLSVDEYLTTYAQAGFNLFRFSQNNCSFQLIDNLDHYHLSESIATDEFLATVRKNGFRVMFGFFGSYEGPSQPRGRIENVKLIIQNALGISNRQQVMAKEKQFIAYAVARWGVYVDFWELLNEIEASDEWITTMVDYVHSVDPDRKPISMSWEKPYLPAIDINAPHWYESESELQSDLRVQQQAVAWKRAGKPVIVGEQGNTGMNWDPLSGLRMRIRSWTAMFQEISLVFWNTGYSKFGMHQGIYTPGAAANIYLGPEERHYVRVLQSFTSRLDADVYIVPVQVSSPSHVRAYGLVSNHVAAVYLHHFSEHTTAVRDFSITLELPGKSDSESSLIGEWIDPSTGDMIARTQIFPGTRTLEVPPFVVDLALLVTPALGQSGP